MVMVCMNPAIKRNATTGTSSQVTDAHLPASLNKVGTVMTMQEEGHSARGTHQELLTQLILSPHVGIQSYKLRMENNVMTEIRSQVMAVTVHV